jgi:fructan beta-fructosidase
VAVDGDPSRSRWVMVVSVQGGAPAGGSGTQYFVGDFDGTTFTADGPPDEVRWVDHGADYYAAVSFSDAPHDRRLLVGWMSNWDYAHDAPTEPHRGVMSAPRVYELRTYDGRLALVQRPVLEGLPAPAHRADLVEVTDGTHRLPFRATSAVVTATLDPGSATRAGLVVRAGDDERTVVGYDAAAGELYLDRTRSGEIGFHPAFAAVHRAPLAPIDGVVRLEVHLDATSVEVYANDGLVVVTDQVFPAEDSDGIAVFADGGTARVRDLEVTPVTD